ncbi:hypothetical protein ACLQ24_23780 [Micromonospora sp. DT4]|uniref:hypothetical protein n=1 Tax=Micromonospora sp. DT4 TaxID=3393438 RepID=UPI003CEB1912
MLVSVLGKGFMYQPTSSGSQVNADLLETANGLSVPQGVTVFVSRGSAFDPALLRYLNQLDPRVRAGYTVMVLDPEKRSPVTDVTALREVAAGLDLPVYAAAPVEGADVVPVDHAGFVTPEASAGYYRILPPSAVAQRSALLDAVRLPGTPSSIQEGLDRLARWHEQVTVTRTQLGLGTNPGDLAHTEPGTHATTYALAAHAARYGGARAFDALTTTEPLTANQVASALGGTLTPVGPAALADGLRRSPGSSALVTGKVTGTSIEQIFWLTSDENGELAWHDPRAAVGAQVFDIDGGNDWRTAVLERDDARAMLVGPDGMPVALPEAVGPAVVGPLNHEVTYVGPWPAKTRDGYRLNPGDLAGMPVIAVDVRVQSGKDRPLDRGQFVEIRSRLERYYLNNVRPTVVATRQHNTIEEFARTYDAAVVQRVMQPGIEDRPGWQVIRPGAAAHTFDGAAVTREMLDAADLSGMTVREPLPPVLVEFLSHESYQQAAQDFAEHADQLREPAVLTAARDLAARFPEDLRLQGLDLALRVAERAPEPAGADPVQPVLMHMFDAQPPWPAGRPVDARFVFDYLTASTRWQDELAPDTGTQPGTTHSNRMAWDSLLFQGMLNGLFQGMPNGGIDPTEAVVLARAVGESHMERAARAAVDGAKESAQAHASIFEATKMLLSNDPAGWRQVLSVDCLSGADRVPWHFRFKELVESDRFKELVKNDRFKELVESDRFKELAESDRLVEVLKVEITELTGIILTCH